MCVGLSGCIKGWVSGLVGPWATSWRMETRGSNGSGLVVLIGSVLIEAGNGFS
jgi:hypothetical protein